MSSFTTPLIVESMDDSRKWKLIEPFEFYLITKGKKEHTIVVPAGFITNFASIPRIFWSVLPPYDKYGKAAVIHDYCYYYHLFPRKKCDQIFKAGMKVLNVPKWKMSVIYHVVRLFGKSHYNKNYWQA